jgi:glyoxylate/hydroxypyruvate reductase
MTTLLFHSDLDDFTTWKEAIERTAPSITVRSTQDAGALEAVTAALVWAPPPGLLRRFPNLKVVINLGAGADSLLRDPTIPPSLPIVRLTDRALIDTVADYVLLYALALHRRQPELAAAQRAQQWTFLPPTPTAMTRIGVMGLGAIGGETARRLAAQGFKVMGWARRPREMTGVECFHGLAPPDLFLTQSDILVNLLPATAQTENLIDSPLLGRLKPGAALINVGRGSAIVEADLLAALDMGHLRHAVLDVFRTEPLPDSHAFWTHPRITLTPHNAGLCHPELSAGFVADVIARSLGGEALPSCVDRIAGY